MTEENVKVLDTYLEQHGVTRYQASKETGISATAFQRASDKHATSINLRVIVALARMFEKTPGQVIDDLILIDLSTKDDLTAEEISWLLITTLSKSDAIALVTTEDVGDFEEGDGTVIESTAIVAEISIPGSDEIRFAVNHTSNEAITLSDVLQDLAAAMSDYDHEIDGDFYPTERDEGAERPLVDAEYIGISKRDAVYLSRLGDKILRQSRG